jgi:hypothetical protein
MMLRFNANNILAMACIVKVYLCFDVYDTVFNDGQVILLGNDPLHSARVFGFVALGSCGLDGGSAAGIERLFLERGKVCIQSHLTPKRIQFEYKMAFGETANRGVARHTRNGVKQTRNQESPDTHASCNQGGLCTRMASADNYDVILIVHARIIPQGWADVDFKKQGKSVRGSISVFHLYALELGNNHDNFQEQHYPAGTP